MLKSFSREPLLHFLMLALAIFAVYGAFNQSKDLPPDQIVVTAPKIEQFVSIFAKTWQRPPTATELKGLIDDYVKEEIYYREALALGLDKDDTVIRRRLRLKMEFLNNSEAAELKPADAELEAYLKANPGKFEIDPALAFRQIFLNPERRGEKIDQDAATVLETLRSNPQVNPSTLGDATLLPAELLLTSRTSISQTFGAAFAEALEKTVPGTWSGPVTSTFGLHLIYVIEHKPGHLPALAESRDAVAREWSSEKRKAVEDQRLKDLLNRYKITIETIPEITSQTEPAK